jgi:phage-related protein
MVWTWQLYRDEEGEIPDELISAFYYLLEDSLDSLKEGIDPALSEQQSSSLRVKIKKLCDFYPKSLSSDDIDSFDDGFYELRLIGKGYSYRFTFMQISPQVFLFLDAFMKNYSGSTRKKDLAATRYRFNKIKPKK